MTDNKNTILAIVLSAIVLMAWQFFVGMPQMEKQRQQRSSSNSRQQKQPTPGAARRPRLRAPRRRPATAPGRRPAAGRAAAAGPRPCRAGRRSPARPCSPRRPRIAIETPQLKGSIALKGGRIDDLALTQYRETVDPKSPPIVLLSPSGTEHPFYAEFGWVRGAGATAKLPDADTVWRQEGAGALAPASRSRSPGTTARASNSAAPSRSTTSTCSPSRTR